MRSKAVWGYTNAFMAACRDELRVDAASLGREPPTSYVREYGRQIVGFYSLDVSSTAQLELDALFVDPPYIGKGHGAALIAHAIRVAGERGASTLLIQGDPNAIDFYLAAGAVQIGERESASIPGRFLPEFVINLSPS